MDKTQATYEDKNFVQVYIDNNAEKQNEIDKTLHFARELEAKSSVLDLGCGPGHLSYVLAGATDENGKPLELEVTGGDYSEEMIKRAKTLRTQDNMPEFKIVDMYKLEELFEEDIFDAVFANASLLHADRENIGKVFEGIVKITKKGGLVYVSIKKGEPTSKNVVEERAGMTIERKFTFWEGKDFSDLAESYGLKLEKTWIEEFPSTSGVPTEWLNYYFRVNK